MAETKRDDSFFASKSKSWYDASFYNNYISNHIAVYRYLADTLFDGDLKRVVWTSEDMIFRKRQEQCSRLIQSGDKDVEGQSIGLLNCPFVGFKINQDAIANDDDRRWFNQTLNVEGVWMEELGRKVRITPMALTYRAVFVCCSEVDLQYIMSKLMWDISNETLLESWITTDAEDGTEQDIRNIINLDLSAHYDDKYNEQEWLDNNRIRTISMDLKCSTFLFGGDRHRYAVTKRVLLDFYDDLELHVHGEADVDRKAEEVIWNIFSEEGAGYDYPL